MKSAARADRCPGRPVAGNDAPANQPIRLHPGQVRQTGPSGLPPRTHRTDSTDRPQAPRHRPAGPLHEIQMRTRREQHTPQRHQRYANRAGTEATPSQTAPTRGMHRNRYRRPARTHLQHALTTTARDSTHPTNRFATSPTTPTPGHPLPQAMR
ncbi:transposase [Streptomyces sp. M19]